MAYKVEVTKDEHEEVLRSTINNWAKEEHDVHLVSIEGTRVFSHKSLLCFYSSHLLEIFQEPTFALLTTPVSISIPSSSSSISLMVRLLVKGTSIAIRRSDLEEVKDTARLLGINFDNCVIDGERANVPSEVSNGILRYTSGQTRIEISRFKNKEISEEETMTRISCDVCDSVFKNSKCLGEHRRKQHRLLKRKEANSNNCLKCDLCGTTFKQRKYLIKHRWFKHGLRTKRLSQEAKENGSKPECEICGTFYKSRRQLLRHRLSKHGLRTRKLRTSLNQNQKVKTDEEKIKKETFIKEEIEEEDEHVDVSTVLDEAVEDATNSFEETCGFCGEMFETCDELNEHKANCS